jgi:IclR family acetate operon transcriptional repressor
MPETPKVRAKPDAAGVKAAVRTLDLIETCAAQRSALSLSQLARLLEIPISSCHELVRTLEGRGYLYTSGARREIYPTGKWFTLARSIVSNDAWLRRVVPLLQALRDRTRETVILGKQQLHRVIYLAVEEGPEAIRFTAQVGDRKPLHVSAIGKTLLATMEAPARGAMIGTLQARYADSPVAFDAEELARDLDRGTRLGWHTEQGGRDFDVMAIATELAVQGETFGVAIVGPLSRMVQVRKRLVGDLLGASRDIEVLLLEHQ